MKEGEEARGGEREKREREKREREEKEREKRERDTSSTSSRKKENGELIQFVFGSLFETR